MTETKRDSTMISFAKGRLIASKRVKHSRNAQKAAKFRRAEADAAALAAAAQAAV